MKKTIFCLFVTVGIIFLSQINAYACRCVAPPSEPLERLVNKARTESEAVFSGKVLSISKKPESGFMLVKIRVEKIWKGESAKEITVKTGMGGADCGYEFKVGKSYLVYAYKSDTMLETNICLRTAELTEAAEDLKALGKGKAVRKGKA